MCICNLPCNLPPVNSWPHTYALLLTLRPYNSISISTDIISGSEADVVPITRALISVSDKAGIVEFATFLASKNVELLSTGGTAKKLREAGLTVIDVSDYTGSAECLDGRVKTLHPKVHGGLLGVRGHPKHEKEMEEHGIGKIDMTILNLYPFEATVAKGAEFEQCIENIDIGGPSMLRSTAKNHAFTTIVTSPDQYEEVQKVMEEKGGTDSYPFLRSVAHAGIRQGEPTEQYEPAFEAIQDKIRQ